MIYIQLLQLCVIVVLIIDISGVMASIRSGLGRWLGASPDRIRFKPFDCSKCMTVWLGLGYALFTGNLTMGVTLYTLVLAVMTPNIATLINIIIEAVRNLLDKILDKLC